MIVHFFSGQYQILKVQQLGGLGSPEEINRCKKFLTRFMTQAGEDPPIESVHMKNLLQELIDNKIDPVTFTKNMQLYSLTTEDFKQKRVQFLKDNIHLMRKFLVTREISIEGIRPPKKNIASNTPTINVMTNAEIRVPKNAPSFEIKADWIMAMYGIENQYKTLKNEISDMKTELNSLKNSSKEPEKEDDTKNDMSALKNENKALKSEIIDMKRDLNSLKNSFEELKDFVHGEQENGQNNENQNSRHDFTNVFSFEEPPERKKIKLEPDDTFSEKIQKLNDAILQLKKENEDLRKKQELCVNCSCESN